MGFSLVILSIIFGLLVGETIIVNRSVASISLRIHINGTRGKSSVTGYIAAGILKSDPELMAKVTGVVPTVIFKGREKTINRYGFARVQEQFKIINQAARAGVKSLVLECMSISPELQRLESRVFKPQIYIITNIKDDHREVMGNSLEEQARSICSAIPYNCKVLTNEKRFLELITKTASERGSSVVCAAELDAAISENLPYGVFPENLSLALAACMEAGVDFKQALDGILDQVKKIKSPLIPIKTGSGKIYFLNAFSVNDVSSTQTFISYWQEKYMLNPTFSVLLNCRSDRPLRTDLFSKWLGSIPSSLEMIYICGTHSGRAKVALLNAGVNMERVRVIKPDKIKDLRKTLSGTLANGSLVVGIGNIMGDGNQILKMIL